MNSLKIVCLILSFSKSLAQVSEGTPCETPDRKYGLCINIKSCDPLLKLLISQSADPKVRNFLISSTCGYAGTTPMVCCPQATAKSNLFDENDNHMREPEIDQGNGIGVTLLRPPNCGFVNKTDTKVVGGMPAKLGEYPWIVALGYKNSKNPGQPKWLCGGTLISQKHILTAAHCVQNRNDLYLARLGELDLYSDTDGANPIDIPLVKAKIHENYSPTAYTNDIAILTLSRSVNHPGVWPICLPADEPLRSNTFIRYNPFVAGWGALYFNGPSSAVLQKVSLPVVSNDQCKRAYGNKSVIDDRIICAGYTTGGKDSCKGDSGGPLMYPRVEGDHFVFFQIGVVSYGFRCAEAGYPGVYTRVSRFIDWIENNLN